jgi:methylamine dehydrogenase accessory protein MauD
MTAALVVSMLVLWIAVAVLAVVVFALVRQIGVLHQRIAPVGALMIGAGPKTGETAPLLELEDLAGATLRIGGENASGRSTLLFFLSPTCPICESLLPAIRAARRSERHWLDFVLASDGDLQAQRRFVAGHDLGDFAYVVSAQLGLTYQVGKLPYAVLIDERGTLRARGLVNSREHLESLFHARDLGLASVQEFLEQRAEPRHESH